MNETQWLACDDSRAMYEFVAGRLPARLRHLFAHACGRRHCRFCWVLEHEDHFGDPQRPRLRPVKRPEAGELCARLLDAADEQCDGADRRSDLVALAQEVTTLEPQEAFHRDLVAAVRGDVGHWVVRDSACPPEESRFQAGLFREIVGNPFRKAAVEPEWLTPDVRALARATYERPELAQGRFDPLHLAVLGDALEDAGCRDERLLGHLREPGVHVRGCWAVDLLLGKR